MSRRIQITDDMLEKYVLGLSSEEEGRIVEEGIAQNPEIAQQVLYLRNVLNDYAAQFDFPPKPKRQPRTAEEMATIDNEFISPESVESSLPLVTRKNIYAALAFALLVACLFLTNIWWTQHEHIANLEASNAQLVHQLAQSKHHHSSVNPLPLLTSPETQVMPVVYSRDNTKREIKAYCNPRLQYGVLDACAMSKESDPSLYYTLWAHQGDQVNLIDTLSDPGRHQLQVFSFPMGTTALEVRGELR